MCCFAMQPKSSVFQFTPLREGRQKFRVKTWFTPYFNSRPSARGDIGQNAGERRGTYFNSRPSARGDHDRQAAAAARPKFQFTPLREGRLEQIIGTDGVIKFQFTPLREGRRETTFTTDALMEFQFTPLREGRRYWQPCEKHHRHFNSRPSARGDTSYRPEQRLYIISIHAPPRGATISRQS